MICTSPRQSLYILKKVIHISFPFKTTKRSVLRSPTRTPSLQDDHNSQRILREDNCQKQALLKHPILLEENGDKIYQFFTQHLGLPVYVPRVFKPSQSNFEGNDEEWQNIFVSISIAANFEMLLYNFL